MPGSGCLVLLAGGLDGRPQQGLGPRRYRLHRSRRHAQRGGMGGRGDVVAAQQLAVVQQHVGVAAPPPADRLVPMLTDVD